MKLSDVLALLMLAALFYLVWCVLAAIVRRATRRTCLRRSGFAAGATVLLLSGLVVQIVREVDPNDPAIIARAAVREAERAQQKAEAARLKMQALAAEEAAAAEKARQEAEERRQAEEQAKAKEEARLAEEAARQAEEAARKEHAEAEARAREEARLAEEEAREDAAREAAALEEEKKAAACRADINCVVDQATTVARRDCVGQIEREARYAVEWTDGWTEPKFSKYRWDDEKAGIMTVVGDRVRFQNGFGAWVPMIYECDILVPLKAVVEVRVKEGRL